MVGPQEREAAEGGLRRQRYVLHPKGLQLILRGAGRPHHIWEAMQPAGQGQAGVSPWRTVQGVDLPEEVQVTLALQVRAMAFPEKLQRGEDARWD